MSRTDVNRTVVTTANKTENKIARLGKPDQYVYAPNVTVQTAETNTLRRAGNITPGFLTLKHFKDVLPLQFAFLKERVEEISGKYVWRTSLGSWNYAPDQTTISGAKIFNFPSEADYDWFGDWASLDAQVRNKMLLELKDQKVNLLQAYAERAQTADLLAKTASRICESILALRKGNFRWAAERLGVSASRSQVSRYHKAWEKVFPHVREVVANGWLELQYGWKPLVMDVYGSAEMIAQARIRESNTHVEVYVKKHYRNNITVRGRETVGPAPTYVIAKESTVKRKMVIAFAVANSPLHTLTQVGITNPLLIAWELMPWSFVVDWFLPVGNFISSFDACNGLNFKSGCYTDCTDYTVRCYATTPGKDNINQKLVSCDAVGAKHRVQINRYPLGSFPGIPLPQFKNPLSLTHMENALALLQQVFNRK